jgi:hypothetical protein
MRDNHKIVIQRLGESFRDCTEIVAAPVRQPQAGEILIRHRFVGVNGVYDQMMCLDRVEHTRVTPPADTGVEAIAVVEEVGKGVTDFEPGDPVVIVKAGFAYRQRQLCTAAELIKVPEASARMLALIAMTLEGSITPLVDDSEFTGLESVADAVEHLLAGRNLGKVVVDVGGSFAAD